ncbi:MAG: MoaD/ThiS family protein [Pirellulales bacterium]|nr:MoaD/ThiS family protein [Pirellulales bacterium]
MSVRVEFFGIPRSRTGVAGTTAVGATLGEVLGEIGDRFANFRESCLEGGSLAAGFTANVNGETFVRDPSTELADGDSVLILSSDAGG